MSETPNHIQQLLKALSEHSALVGIAMRGPVSTGGKRDKGVETLIRMRALMPVDEDTYYLNPLLREFIGDYVVSYGAFRQLTRLDGPIRQLRLEFDSLRDFRREGSFRDSDRAMSRLEESIVRIGFYMDQNLQLLSAKVSTNFGDVDSVGGKIRENQFYYGEVKRFGQQISSLDAKAQEMDSQSIGEGFAEVHRLLNVRILSRLRDWAARITDIQRVVSKNLFSFRQLEAQQRNLARVALWLSKNRLSDGFEVEITTEIADRLTAPVALISTWNIDVTDTDPVVAQGMLTAAKRLPSATPVAKQAPMTPPVVVSTRQEIEQPQPAPIDELVDAYLDFLTGDEVLSVQADLSLLRWRRRLGSAYGLDNDTTDEEWLLYAYSQISSAGYAVDLEIGTRAPGEFNDLFTDASARLAEASRP
ncbi:hypothetical protein [Hydrogenophaga sp. PAMC20947]|uniref:hypothetical protein n=1 Tax=Hydrogenophaga sp. PAMC20947 TaxID=2565558 RepID=UPI00109DF083|nr:hypothetical protein [Hydrogenophaga sp. PAMC20947]QCB46943.1 hypothetical protein E5678_13480 [Hydrogenophaga sp. PAMC20947]